MNLGLPVDQRLHFVGIVQDFFVHELGVDFFVFLEHVDNLSRSFLNDFTDRLVFVQLRFLRQVPHAQPGRPGHVSRVRLVQTGDDAHDGGFTGAVRTEDANFGTVVKPEGDVFEDVLTSRGDFVHPVHAENDFFVV